MCDSQPIREIRRSVVEAFAVLPRPGNWALSGTSEGPEGAVVQEEFSGLEDWRNADAKFLLRHIRYGSLSWLSHEAFRFFLPAFLVADLDGLLGEEGEEVALCLVEDFASGRRDEPVNPLRFGARTWWNRGVYAFSTFQRTEASAILAYLKWRASRSSPLVRQLIGEAIDVYWEARSRE